MSSRKTMLIDTLPPVSPRPTQMEVLAMGFSRTGTVSLAHSLETIGLKSYLTVNAYFDGTFKYWLEALRAKYGGEGRPYGKDEFDKLLGHYNAVLDLPCIMFVDELLAAYPNAKVVLTQRDVDSWLISMDKAFKFMSWKSFDYIAPFDPVTIGPYWKLMKYVFDIWTDGNRNDHRKLAQIFHEHYHHVRTVVPKEMILEFTPTDGFESLCKFLDKPIPAHESYPHLNRSGILVENNKRVWRKALAIAVKRIVINLGAVAVAAGAVWYYFYRMLPSGSLTQTRFKSHDWLQ